MYVSLCGPHSFETSTLPAVANEVVAPPPGISPLLIRYWYLSHQVGLFGLFDCATAGTAQSSIAAIRESLRMKGNSFRARVSASGAPSPRDDKSTTYGHFVGPRCAHVRRR